MYIWIPNVKSLRIPKILVSCGLSNLLHITVYKYQGSRIYPKDFGFLRIVQSLAFLLYTFNAHYLSLCIFATYAYIPKTLVSCGLSNQGFRIYVCIVQSFLLYTSIKSSKEFPAYSWVVHSCLTTRGGKPSYLRTVIVTAAVYWGFSR